jgi:hypothetical protein
MPADTDTGGAPAVVPSAGPARAGAATPAVSAHGDDGGDGEAHLAAGFRLGGVAPVLDLAGLVPTGGQRLAAGRGDGARLG